MKKKKYRGLLCLAACVLVLGYPLSTSGEWEEREYHDSSLGTWVEEVRPDGIAWRYKIEEQYASNTWIQDRGNWYYIDGEGVLLTNGITPDEEWVGPDGIWIEDIGIDENMMREKSAGRAALIFDKSSHRLELWKNGERIYRVIGTSGSVAGDKEVEGDRKTPTGEFYITIKNTKSKYYKSLGLSYPSYEDAQRGLNQGLISQKRYNKLIDTLNRGGQPNWYTPLGGEIMIHGQRNPIDGTQGCISIKNEDIDFIWQHVEVGSPVIVQE